MVSIWFARTLHLLCSGENYSITDQGRGESPAETPQYFLSRKIPASTRLSRLSLGKMGLDVCAYSCRNLFVGIIPDSRSIFCDSKPTYEIAERTREEKLLHARKVGHLFQHWTQEQPLLMLVTVFSGSWLQTTKSVG